MSQPCQCGGTDCRACHPEHFRGNQYLDPEGYCDGCQTYYNAKYIEVCEWCNKQLCPECRMGHYDGRAAIQSHRQQHGRARDALDRGADRDGCPYTQSAKSGAE